jgi:probable HAF family extracellular repeat protein
MSFASVLALALCVVAGPASAGPYTLIDLATLDEGATVVVRGVNGGGTAVGGGRVGGSRRGLLFTQAGLQAVDGLDGSDYSVVFDINDLGAVVGGSNAPTAARAFVRPRAGAARELVPLPGDTASTAFGINNHHQAAGVSSGAGGERAVLWSADGSVAVLPGVAGQESRARAINDRGDVVGAANGGAGLLAVVWRGGGSALQLGTLPGRATSEAVAVNARGDIVGYSSDASGARRATLWTAGGAVVDLGALAGGEFSQALGINNAGHIVGSSTSSLGSRACLWTPGEGLRDLNTLVAPSSSVLTHATGINRAGAIVAFGHEAVSHDEPDGQEGHGHDDTHELPVRVFLLLPSGARP